MTSFGIIKERKNPPDKRVVLTPEFCQVIKDEYPHAKITIEPSGIRVFKDNEYREMIKVEKKRVMNRISIEMLDVVSFNNKYVINGNIKGDPDFKSKLNRNELIDIEFL